MMEVATGSRTPSGSGAIVEAEKATYFGVVERVTSDGLVIRIEQVYRADAELRQQFSDWGAKCLDCRPGGKLSPENDLKLRPRVGPL